MKPLNKLSSDEKTIVSDTIYANAERVDGKWEAKNNISKFGICSDCDYFTFVESEFRIEFAKCVEFNLILNGKTAFINCNCFHKRGQLNLSQMKDIAWIIDLPKERAGF